MKIMYKNYKLLALITISVSVFLSSCAAKIVKPDQLTAPTPIYGNNGKYMCPFTQDGVMAEWTDKAIKAKIGATIGRHAGAYIGKEALKQVPFIGGLLGSEVGESIGREIAIKNAGGMDYIKQTSDISFDNINDMSVYLYVKYSSHEHFKNALEAAMEIYPKLKKGYYKALVNASKNIN